MPEDSQESGTTRRTFHHRVIYGLWSLITAALAWPAVAYLLFSTREDQGNEWMEVGDISDLKVNNPEEFVFERTRPDGWRMKTEEVAAWVVKTPQEEIVAFAPMCTHLACAYHWEEERERFLCPCHETFFSVEGAVLNGPAPRPLDRYRVRIEGKRLWLGRILKSEGVPT